mmetsp:Transcript_22286/g.33182  ORF Transcript_22286/g.33182 Transcript_22286/m.33182 type:complete len:84 (+) Transcript_22286:302-553(+)
MILPAEQTLGTFMSDYADDMQQSPPERSNMDNGRRNHSNSLLALSLRRTLTLRLPSFTNAERVPKVSVGGFERFISWQCSIFP